MFLRRFGHESSSLKGEIPSATFAFYLDVFYEDGREVM